MLTTPWGERLNRLHPLPEYPRPQFRRASYWNLNGPWDYAVTDSGDPPPAWEGEIVVPFSPESALSGVGRGLRPGQALWYRRALEAPAGFLPEGYRLLVHFGAVDQEADLFVNGRHAGHHMGGYNAFSVDVTEFLRPEGNELLVRARDDTDASYRSRGKQSTKRGGIWYTPQSGIWQTVWAEAVPARHMTGLSLTPLFDKSTLRVTVSGPEGAKGMAGAEGFPPVAFTANVPFEIPVPGFEAWSPEHPRLYALSLTLEDDHAESYFAMRKTEIRADEKGVKRLFLNNRPYFHNGVLDQGYWPDGLYTAPADEAMVFDIETMKKLGFNMLRKHIKVEPMRWYYHCDRLGMLVWQDMPSGGGPYRFSTVTLPLITGRHRRDDRYAAFGRESPQGRAEYEGELKEMVAQLYNVPSVVLWVPFNEGWGQFDAARVYNLLRSLDPTRPVDHASGWHDQGVGEFKSLHVYFKPYRFRPDRLGRAVALTEFGGYNLRVEGHTWNDESNFGYRRFKSQQALWQAYRALYEKQIRPAIPRGLCAAVYTQLSDVEDELNGLVTYDRRVLKLPSEDVARLNAGLSDAMP